MRLFSPASRKLPTNCSYPVTNSAIWRQFWPRVGRGLAEAAGTRWDDPQPAVAVAPSVSSTRPFSSARPTASASRSTQLGAGSQAVEGQRHGHAARRPRLCSATRCRRPRCSGARARPRAAGRAPRTSPSRARGSRGSAGRSVRMKVSSESGSRSWSATLTYSGPKPPSTTGPGSRDGAAVEKPPFLLVGPLHRRPDRQPALGGQVLAHADLLAVEQHRRAGQREQQAVDHPDPARVAVEHRRQPADQAAAVDLHLRLGPEGGEHLLALVVGQLVQGELVVVADERGPLALRLRLRPCQQRLDQRARRPRGRATR